LRVDDGLDFTLSMLSDTAQKTRGRFLPIGGFCPPSPVLPDCRRRCRAGEKYQLRPNRRTRGQQCVKKYERQGFGIGRAGNREKTWNLADATDSFDVYGQFRNAVLSPLNPLPTWGCVDLVDFMPLRRFPTYHGGQ